MKPAPAKESEAKGSASPAAPAGKRILSQDEIGHVAGEVWHLLSNQGTQTLPGLKKAIDAPGDIVLAAIGWLAREGKLDLQAKGRSVKVSLR